MKIAYLDGQRLYRVLYAGIQNLLDEQDYLNKINVFPVPDGDTGTNMALTMMGVVEHLQTRSRAALPDLGQEVAAAALDNARGNSGVILAQFFQGLSEGLTQVKLTTVQFAEAVNSAMRSAYTAMAEPREGTILTVIRRWSEDLSARATHTRDFSTLLESSLSSAKKALADTPKMLDVLREAGVVDAAGHGFVSLLEGISHFMKDGNLRSLPRIAHEEHDLPADRPNSSEINLSFPYCTECFVSGQNLDREALSTHLRQYGDSLIVAGTKHRAKIHIHTDRPREMFESLEPWGTVSGQKIDDMRVQYKSTSDRKRIALVIDSTCDLPPEILEAHHIHMVPVRINFGTDEYIDKVTLSEEEFYQKLETDPRHPKTSQPPPGDFRRMYQFLASHYDGIISLHVPANSSGTLQNAEKTLAKIKVDKSRIIDSLSLSVGIGFSALEMVSAIEAGASFEEVVAIGEATVEQTKLWIGLETLDAAIKGGRVSVSKKRLLDLLHLSPILTMSREGRIAVDGISLGKAQDMKGFEKYILKKVRDKRIKRFGVAHADNLVVAQRIHDRLAKHFPEAEHYMTGVCPALGVHGGRGVIGIAVQYL